MVVVMSDHVPKTMKPATQTATSKKDDLLSSSVDKQITLAKPEHNEASDLRLSS
jgi:hypothetical protein